MTMTKSEVGINFCFLNYLKTCREFVIHDPNFDCKSEHKLENYVLNF